MRLAWDGCWSTGMRTCLFPFSLLIYTQKEVCMWKWIEGTVCAWQEWLMTELLPAMHTLLCFHSGYFCFMYIKKASMNTYQGGGGGGRKPEFIVAGW